MARSSIGALSVRSSTTTAVSLSTRRLAMPHCHLRPISSLYSMVAPIWTLCQRRRSLITCLQRGTAANRAVIIGNPDPAARSRELPCYPPFATFLATELLPWVRKNYRVATDPARVTIGGSSYGGLAASYAALAHPDLSATSSRNLARTGGGRIRVSRRTNGSPRRLRPASVPTRRAFTSTSASTRPISQGGRAKSDSFEPAFPRYAAGARLRGQLRRVRGRP